MATRDIGVESFNDTIDREGIVFVDFWAAWCGPCRRFAPIFEQASKRHTDITWAKVDVDKEQALAGAFAVRSIPTLMVFRDGVLVYEQPGALSQPALEELVGKVRKLDMTDVKRRMAEREAAVPESGAVS